MMPLIKKRIHTLQRCAPFQILTNFGSVLVKVPTNLLVKSLVPVVDVANISFFKLHSLPFLLYLLFDSSIHFIGQTSSTLPLSSFVRGTEYWIEGFGRICRRPEWCGSTGQAFKVALIVSMLSFWIVIVLHFKSIGSGLFFLFVCIFLMWMW